MQLSPKDFFEAQVQKRPTCWVRGEFLKYKSEWVRITWKDMDSRVLIRPWLEARMPWPWTHQQAGPSSFNKEELGLNLWREPPQTWELSGQRTKQRDCRLTWNSASAPWRCLFTASTLCCLNWDLFSSPVSQWPVLWGDACFVSARQRVPSRKCRLSLPGGFNAALLSQILDYTGDLLPCFKVRRSQFSAKERRLLHAST